MRMGADPGLFAVCPCAATSSLVAQLNAEHVTKKKGEPEREW